MIQLMLPQGKMRQCVLILTMVLLLPCSASGFDLSWGTKVGLSHSFFSGADYDSYLYAMEYLFEASYPPYSFDFRTKLNLGFYGGLFLTIGILDFLALQPEVYYVQGGGSYGFDPTGPFGRVTFTDKLNYVETLLLTVIRLPAGEIDFDLFAGPALCLRVGKVGIELEEDGSIATGEWPEDQFARIFYNIVFGAGVTFYLARGWILLIDARYSMGLTSIMNEGVTGLRDWKQNAVRLLIGFGRIVIGKKTMRSELR